MFCSQCEKEYCKCAKNHEYFLKEYTAFREIMCSTKYSFEQKTEAHERLLAIYMLVKFDNKENEKLRVHIITTIDIEFAKRMSYELFMFKE